MSTTAMTTPAPNSPTVSFERQSYSAQVVANSEPTDEIVKVSAVASNQQIVEYSLQQDVERFQVDSIGSIRAINPLSPGTYRFRAVAKIVNGSPDTATATVYVVENISNNDSQFASPLYQFSINENSTGNIGSVQLNKNDSYSIYIKWSDPSAFQDHFNLAADGSLSVIKKISRQATPVVVLEIAANRTDFQAVPAYTIVNVSIIDVNESPYFIGYPAQLVVGYPKRTFIDAAVPMPFLQLQASDPDFGDNAVLSYNIDAPLSNHFDIDTRTGLLYATDNVACNDICKISVSVSDLPGLSASQNITIQRLAFGEIHLLNATGSQDLTDDEIAKDLSDILNWRVSVLQKTKSKAGTIRKRKLTDYDYVIAVYAVDGTRVVLRNQFVSAIAEQASQFDRLSWKLNTTRIDNPPDYEPDKIIAEKEAISQSKSDFTIATAVLGALLALALVGAVIFFVYESIWDRESRGSTSKEGGERRDSLTISRSSLAKRGVNLEDADYNEYSTDTVGSNSFSQVKQRIQISNQRTYINEELDKRTAPAAAAATKKQTDSDEVYCPESPKPKKSILKERNESVDTDQDSIESKDKRRSGVKFHPEDDVIQLASTVTHTADEDVADDVEFAEL